MHKNGVTSIQIIILMFSSSSSGSIFQNKVADNNRGQSIFSASATQSNLFSPASATNIFAERFAKKNEVKDLTPITNIFSKAASSSSSPSNSTKNLFAGSYPLMPSADLKNPFVKASELLPKRLITS